MARKGLYWAVFIQFGSRISFRRLLLAESTDKNKKSMLFSKIPSRQKRDTGQKRIERHA